MIRSQLEKKNHVVHFNKIHIDYIYVLKFFSALFFFYLKHNEEYLLVHTAPLVLKGQSVG